MIVAALAALVTALVWSVYPPLYVAAARGGDALPAFEYLAAFELGKLVMAAGLRRGGLVGRDSWWCSPWFALSFWHGTVNCWFAVAAAYAGAGLAVFVIECWPLPAGLLLVWARRGRDGLWRALTPGLVFSGLVCVVGLLLVSGSGGQGAVWVGLGSWERLVGLGAALLAMSSAAARTGAVAFAAQGAGGGAGWGRADVWHISAYAVGALLSLAGSAGIGFGSVGLGWLALGFGYGAATMVGHHVLNRLFLVWDAPALHLPLYAVSFAGVGWLWLLDLERPEQPAVFLLGGGLILAGNLLGLRRLN